MKTKYSIMILLCLITALVAVSPGATPDTNREKSFTVGKTSSLDASVSGGDLIVKTWDKNEIMVVAEGLDDDDLEYLKMTQSGDNVRVTFRPKWGSRGNARFIMTVPTQCQVDLRTSGGNIELQGNLLANAKGSTSGGDITIEKVKGTVTMSTSGGEIKTGDIDGRADLHTSGGNIDLASVNGEATISTSGGDIRIANVGKKLDARTSGGNIEVGDIGGDATLSTAGGDVRVGKVTGNAYLRTAGGDLELKGASGTVAAKTSGGDVDLKNITGSVEAKTSGGNIRAELTPSGTGQSVLKSSGGDIHLVLPSGAKATIDALIRLREGWNWLGDSNEHKYDIKSDFKADSYEKDPHGEEIRAKYVLNGGGESISIETVNGNITIRKK